jgi:hypothetical protein
MDCTYLVFVKLRRDERADPADDQKTRARLDGFLTTTFGDRAHISNDFGIGEMGIYRAMTVSIEVADTDGGNEDEQTRGLLTDWLQAQVGEDSFYYWQLGEEGNPLYCPDGEDDADLASAVRRHYGALLAL